MLHFCLKINKINNLTKSNCLRFVKILLLINQLSILVFRFVKNLKSTILALEN